MSKDEVLMLKARQFISDTCGPGYDKAQHLTQGRVRELNKIQLIVVLNFPNWQVKVFLLAYLKIQSFFFIISYIMKPTNISSHGGTQPYRPYQ